MIVLPLLRCIFHISLTMKLITDKCVFDEPGLVPHFLNTISHICCISGNKFLFGNMTHQTVNSTFSMASPRLCSRENITALFKFGLFTGGCNNYVVLVYLEETNGVSCLLWSGQSTYREMSPEIRINNTLCNNSLFRVSLFKISSNVNYFDLTLLHKGIL